MVLAEHSEFINAPAEQVFDLFFDFERRRTLSDVTALEIIENQQPLGTQYTEERFVAGRAIPPQTFTVVDFQQNQRFAVEANANGIPITVNYDFFPSDTSTEVRVTFEAQFKGFLGRIMGLFKRRLAAPVSQVLASELSEYKLMAEQAESTGS